MVRRDGAAVYRSPDFDSPVLGYLHRGHRFMVSSQVFGAFFKIQLAKNKFGYVPDVDMVTAADAVKKKGKTNKGAAKDDKPEEKPKDETAADKPYEFQRYRGLKLEMINYRENTMGLRPTANILFYGFQFYGPRVLTDVSYLNVDVLFSIGAPSYYQQATGRSASGFIFLPSVTLESALPKGKNTLINFGFGPSFRYSKFAVETRATFQTGPGTEDYNLEDMSLGLKLDAAVSYRISRVSLKLNVDYFFEVLQYYGVGLSATLRF